MKLTPILRSINVLNVLLLAALLLFSGFILLPLIETDVQFTPPVAKKSPAGDGEEKPAEAAVQILSPVEFASISEQNLFHPERIIPPEKKEAAPLPKPEFVLYGTLVTEDVQMAFMEDKKAPYSTPGRGPRQTAVRLGQAISGFVLKEIGTDSVFMVRGEESMVVHLEDATKPKGREVTGVAPAPVPAPGAVAPAPGVPAPAPGAPAPASAPATRRRFAPQRPASTAPQQPVGQPGSQTLERNTPSQSAAMEDARNKLLDVFRGSKR